MQISASLRSMRSSVTCQRVSDATAWVCWLCGRTCLFWYRSRHVSGSVSRGCRFRLLHPRRNERLQIKGSVNLRLLCPSVHKPDGNGCVNCLCQYPPQANPRSRSGGPRPHENPTALTIGPCPQCLNLLEQIERKRDTSSVQPAVGMRLRPPKGSTVPWTLRSPYSVRPA
jgi:hypothetical protein